LPIAYVLSREAFAPGASESDKNAAIKQIFIALG